METTEHLAGWKVSISEAKEVDEGAVSECTLIAGYEPENETGLSLPNKTLTLEGEKCVGGKMSKERSVIW